MGRDPLHHRNSPNRRATSDRAGPRSRRFGGERIRFTSKWSLRARSFDALLPVLYLRGISAGDFHEALAALLGKTRPTFPRR